MIRIPDQMRMSRISNQIEIRNDNAVRGRRSLKERDGSGSGSLDSAVGVEVEVERIEIVVSFSSRSF
jgi:hypothetical protein